jgi:hypothetical protein
MRTGPRAASAANLDTDAVEERAGDRRHRVAGEHPGRHKVGPVGGDQVLDVCLGR